MSITKELIPIATTIDANYTQHLGVMLCSLFENNLNNRFIIYLVINFDENREVEKLRSLVTGYTHQLEIININDDLLSYCKVTDHVTLATYYRLLIPNMIDQALTKILYLDADMIITKDILDLWNSSFDGHIVGAVEEPFFDRHKALRIPITAKYFNAGVLLINLVDWRKNDITAKAIDYIKNNADQIKFWDQDVLNSLLYDKWLHLPKQWNVTTTLFTSPVDKIKIDENELSHILHDPSIIHYTGSSKPWHYLNTHPFKGEYYKYLQATAWKNFKHPEESHWHKMKQFFKQKINILYGRKKFEVYN